MSQRRQPPSKVVDEVQTSIIEESDDDDEENGKTKDSKNSLKIYVLVVLVVIFCLSYLYERDLRYQLIEEFNNNIDKASKELASSRLRNSQQTQSTVVSTRETPCPKCPDCPDNQEDIVQTVDPDLIFRQWKSRDLSMMSELQRMSRELLKLKFGVPPYYVELEVAVSDEANIPEVGKIMIEMAPIDAMPYSVLYFMSHVASGAWDSCSFFLNLGVVYLEDARGKDTCRRDLFVPGDEFSTPERLAVQEYSPAYRHEALTVGLSGRPGGLGLYINLVNNTKPLGPKGEVVEGGPPRDADPCIGKVIRGEEFVTKLKRIEKVTESGTERLFQDIAGFEDKVTIKSASIIQASLL